MSFVRQTLVKDPNQQAGLLAHLTRAVAACCLAKDSDLFHRSGLSAGEGHVLLAIAAAGEASPSEVAATLKLGRSRLTPLAQSLVEKGFLARRESEDDRRVRSLQLTEAGAIAAHEAMNLRLKFHERLLSMFDDDERTQVLDVLTRLHERMQEVRQEYFAHKSLPTTT